MMKIGELKERLLHLNKIYDERKIMFMNLDYTMVKFENLRVPKTYSSKIRGYFGNKYKEYEVLHNHRDNGFVFEYPKVQYKIIDENPLICALNEGCSIVAKLGVLEDEITIDHKSFDISQKEIIKKKVNFGINNDYIEYKFLSPWMALNQKNIHKYDKCNNIEKEEFLKSILIGNIISMSKGIGYTVPNKIYAWINLEEINVKLKGINMKAFKGTFKTNFIIPDYLGIGKSVSRGFGTVKAVKGNEFK